LSNINKDQIHLLSLDQPQVIHAGRSRYLKRRLLEQARDNSKVASKLGDQCELFVYWAETSSSDALEQDLILDLSPPYNRVTLALMSSARLAIDELEELLRSRVSDESRYQSFFTHYPWVLGLQYSLIEAHKKFNDENIPDFTGMRARDQMRDILEIKQPFLSLQRSDGSLSAEFFHAWSQAERYLDFARTEADYLRRQKGLNLRTRIAI
jgi:hypothetical protein